MGKDNLFIAGMPAGFTEESIRSIFAPYGAILSIKVLPGNSKPDTAALVRMQDPAMAAWLVENLNGNIPLGLTTPVSVRYAQTGAGNAPVVGGKGIDGYGGDRFAPYGQTGAGYGGQPAASPAPCGAVGYGPQGVSQAPCGGYGAPAAAPACGAPQYGSQCGVSGYGGQACAQAQAPCGAGTYGAQASCGAMGASAYGHAGAATTPEAAQAGGDLGSRVRSHGFDPVSPTEAAMRGY